MLQSIGICQIIYISPAYVATCEISQTTYKIEVSVCVTRCRTCQSKRLRFQPMFKPGVEYMYAKSSISLRFQPMLEFAKLTMRNI